MYSDSVEIGSYRLHASDTTKLYTASQTEIIRLEDIHVSGLTQSTDNSGVW